MTRDKPERRDAAGATSREDEQRWRTVVTGAPVVLFALDREGVFTLSEGRGLTGLGLSPGEVVGRSVFEVYAGHDAICDAARRAVAGEALHQQVEVSGLAWDLRYSPLLDEDGTPTGTIGVATDITEQRRLERKVQESRRLESIGILAGGIAHSFNNLLMAVLGNTALALTQLPPDHEVRGLLDRAEAAAHRAADLTSHILAFSGQGAFAVEPHDLGMLVDGLRPELEAAAPAAVRLEIDRPDGLPPVEVDRGRVIQVVRNLVQNALESFAAASGTVPAPGKVSVRLGVRQVTRADLEDAPQGESCAPGGYLALAVSDDGMGMDAETRTRVFDPFFSTKAQGRGLGLAAVLGIIRGHGGAVRLESTPGRGTVVEALFPLDGSASEGEEDGVMAAPADGTSGSLLVVDDEEMVREVAVEILQVSGYEVHAAESGEKALDTFEQHGDEIALVLLDFTMPGLGGEATFRALREKCPDLPIVVMSGLMKDELKDLLSEDAGPNQHLQKPFEMKDLAETVAQLLT